MKRRHFLQLSTMLPFAAVATKSAFATRTSDAPRWRTFEVTTQVAIAEPAGRTQLWLPVPLAIGGDYQRRDDLHWNAPGAQAELVKISGYDVELLHVQWPDAQSVRPMQMATTVSTRDRRATLNAESAAMSAISASTLQ